MRAAGRSRFDGPRTLTKNSAARLLGRFGNYRERNQCHRAGNDRASQKVDGHEACDLHRRDRCVEGGPPSIWRREHWGARWYSQRRCHDFVAAPPRTWQPRRPSCSAPTNSGLPRHPARLLSPAGRDPSKEGFPNDEPPRLPRVACDQTPQMVENAVRTIRTRPA